MIVISEAAMLSELSAEFAGYECRTRRTWEGVSLDRRAAGSSDHAGPYVVVARLDEMRRRPAREQPGGKPAS